MIASHVWFYHQPGDSESTPPETRAYVYIAASFSEVSYVTNGSMLFVLFTWRGQILKSDIGVYVYMFVRWEDWKGGGCGG